MDKVLQDGVLLFEFKKADNIEEEVTVDRMNAIISAINANRITKVVNGYFKRTSEGIVIVCDVGSSGTPMTISHPWQVTAYSDSEHPDDQIVQIQAGKCQGDFVTLDGQAFDYWSDNKMTIPGTGERDGYIGLCVEWNAFGQIVSRNVTWYSGNIPATEDAQIGSNGHSYLELAYINIIADGNKLKMEIRQSAFHNVFCTVAPNNRGWFFGV